MTVELRSGDLRGTLDCGEDVFFVGCRLTDSNRPNRNNILNILVNPNMIDNFEEFKLDGLELYKELFSLSDVRMSELNFANGMYLLLCCYITDDPSILATIKSYTGMKMIEVVHGDMELTITV